MGELKGTRGEERCKKNKMSRIDEKKITWKMKRITNEEGEEKGNKIRRRERRNKQIMDSDDTSLPS